MEQLGADELEREQLKLFHTHPSYHLPVRWHRVVAGVLTRHLARLPVSLVLHRGEDERAQLGRTLVRRLLQLKPALRRVGLVAQDHRLHVHHCAAHLAEAVPTLEVSLGEEELHARRLSDILLQVANLDQVVHVQEGADRRE